MNILVTGATGLVGSALTARLQQDESVNVLAPSRYQLDLLSQQSINQYLGSHKIDLIIHCAAKVGGIMANIKYPADFFHHNVMMNTMLVESAKNAGIFKMIVLNSGCVYANDYEPPHEEWAILLGKPHKDHAPYAYAKRLLNVQSQAYEKQYNMQIIVAILSNLYGPNDNFNLDDGHVMPSLIRKFVTAKHNGEKTVNVWGDGFPKRDFLFVDDLADALLILKEYCFCESPPIKTNVFNIGAGHAVTIRSVCQQIQSVLDMDCEVVWNYSKPNGQMEKYLDISRMKMLGWHPKTDLRQGIAITASWLEQNFDHIRQ